MEKVEKKQPSVWPDGALVKNCVEDQPRVHDAPIAIIPMNPFLRTPRSYAVIATGSVV